MDNKKFVSINPELLKNGQSSVFSRWAAHPSKKGIFSGQVKLYDSAYNFSGDCMQIKANQYTVQAVE
jgi:hypothetical protein